MHIFNVNRFFVRRVCFLTFIACVCLLLPFANARAGSERAEKSLEEMMYPDNKKGCENKASFFAFMVGNYKKGLPASDFFKAKMFNPLVERVYVTIRKKGVEKATIDNMKEYITCVKSAGVHKHQKVERDLTLTHVACAQFTGIMLETLGAIKQRKKPGALMRKYEGRGPDMTWTRYNLDPNSTLYYIASLYKMAKTEKYGDVVQAASKVSLSCYL